MKQNEQQIEFFFLICIIICIGDLNEIKKNWIQQIQQANVKKNQIKKTKLKKEKNQKEKI